MKADLRISIKDYRRNKNLKVLRYRPPFRSQGFLVTTNGRPWPRKGGAMGISRVLTALRKALVRASPKEMTS